MNQAKKEFLSLVTPPARLGINETAWLMGFNEHDIPVLVSVGLLKPLGRPSSTGSKYFAAVELQTLRNDTRWLAKASDAIVNYWRSKNSGRKSHRVEQRAIAA
ncbi:MAG TPA: hypothetical protein VGY98_04780 [Verrucomicrobiae bacterium]|nr:hypothetical protein [Verrucomicrobiae bacterium]